MIHSFNIDCKLKYQLFILTLTANSEQGIVSGWVQLRSVIFFIFTMIYWFITDFEVKSQLWHLTIGADSYQGSASSEI